MCCRIYRGPLPDGRNGATLDSTISATRQVGNPSCAGRSARESWRLRWQSQPFFSIGRSARERRPSLGATPFSGPPLSSTTALQGMGRRTTCSRTLRTFSFLWNVAVLAKAYTQPSHDWPAPRKSHARFCALISQGFQAISGLPVLYRRVRR